MKTSTLLASLLIIISQASFANQPEGKRPDMAELATQLQLDTSQATQLEKIMFSHHQTMQQLHKQKQQDRKNRQSIRDQHREQLLTILDHQQLYQLETYMHEFRPQGKSHKKSD